jgi:hypothetical protein
MPPWFSRDEPVENPPNGAKGQAYRKFGQTAGKDMYREARALGWPAGAERCLATLITAVEVWEAGPGLRSRGVPFRSCPDTRPW